MSARYLIPALIRGNTFKARNIARLSQASVDIGLSRAQLVVTDKSGSPIYTWDTDGVSPNASITGAGSNTVHLNEVDPTITSGWPIGVLIYSLTVWYALSGDKETIFQGTFEVTK